VHKPISGAETLKPLAGPMVAIVFDGRGKIGAPGEEVALERGAVLFVGAGTTLNISDGVEVWAALYDE
jgi:mannose-6-phosphate isomerase class I